LALWKDQAIMKKTLKIIGLILLVYIIVVVILLGFYIGTNATCNEFYSRGPVVEESVLCKPIIYLIGMPVRFVTEVLEAVRVML
jgi:hypothetical protein